MRSLRLRLTLALDGMSRAALVLMGGLARWIALRRFDDLVIERAFGGFRHEIASYYRTYGSWEAAAKAEKSPELARRTMPWLFSGSRGHGAGPPADARPPARPGNGGNSNRYFDLGGSPPPFVVVDAAGTILVDLAGYRAGDVVAPEHLGLARPIEVGGEPVGLAVPVERPTLTTFEKRYLSAMEDTSLYSMLIASLLAVPIGLWLGSRFASPVKELRAAIGRMRGGALHQSVPVRYRDKLGQLASTFNTMSEELAAAYAEFEESRARIGEQAERMRDLSRRDDLTQLANRRAFDDGIGTLAVQAARYGHALTVALADVDRFRSVNDDFSHQTGDEVLKVIATLIQRHVREVDLVARYGGEEFAIALTETGLEGAARLADRLHGLVAGHDWDAVAPGLRVTLSVGLAELGPGRTPRETLGEADARLYEAKNAGRNCVKF